jgi:hypothetical protein
MNPRKVLLIGALTLPILVPLNSVAQTLLPTTDKECPPPQVQFSDRQTQGGAEADEPPALPDASQATIPNASQATIPDASQQQQRCSGAGERPALPSWAPDLTGVSQRAQVSIPVGTEMTAMVETPISSKNARTGDEIRVRLAQDLLIGNDLIAAQGADILGHITYVASARSKLHSKLSRKRWCQSSGCLGLQFEQIVTDSGRVVPISAIPEFKSPIYNDSKKYTKLCVNQQGLIRPTVRNSLKQEAKPLIVSALTSGTSAAVSAVATPIGGALAGAAVGAFAGYAQPKLLLSPTEERRSHPRLKGAALGAIGGVPGGFLVTQAVTRGQEVTLHASDQIVLQVVDSSQTRIKSASTDTPARKKASGAHG